MPFFQVKRVALHEMGSHRQNRNQDTSLWRLQDSNQPNKISFFKTAKQENEIINFNSGKFGVQVGKKSQHILIMLQSISSNNFQNF
jgi:hypothetical protein